MSYQSIDMMQNELSKTVFQHVESPKKAAGRALGTIVEIISYYLIKAWGHEYKTAIERPLQEYANKDITHNVEFTFHRSKKIKEINVQDKKSISSTKIFNDARLDSKFVKSKTSRNLIKDDIIKNACTVAYSKTSFCNAYFNSNRSKILIYELNNYPFAMFECKRVGVEEGNKKGPQTIEKAKQGSYVARTVSSIQRVRRSDGSIIGVVEQNGKFDFFDEYNTFIEKSIFEHKVEILNNFILTVGIVSNHGNWFTSENQNKELKVLAQSYDWLLFLTDEGLSSFIQNILLNKSKEYIIIRNAFMKSYAPGKKSNIFTKTSIDSETDKILTNYFINNLSEIQSWFNIISPTGKTIEVLQKMLNELSIIGV